MWLRDCRSHLSVLGPIGLWTVTYGYFTLHQLKFEYHPCSIHEYITQITSFVNQPSSGLFILARAGMNVQTFGTFVH